MKRAAMTAAILLVIGGGTVVLAGDPLPGTEPCATMCTTEGTITGPPPGAEPRVAVTGQYAADISVAATPALTLPPTDR